MKDKYVFEEDMAEISGLGGGYEQNCRKMLKAGLEYMDEHPECEPIFKGHKGIYGVLSNDNEDAKKLSDVVISATNDCTGAMHQAVITTILWIRKNGWDDYVLAMKKAKKEKENSKQ